MPELPEVESTARFLHERIAGDRVIDVAVLWPRTVGDVAHFKKWLTGAKIERVFRRAKFVCFQCNNSRDELFVVAAHMRMTGSFDVFTNSSVPDKHDRILLKLESGKCVSFCDPRKFGRAKIELDFEDFSKKLGVEPLTAEFTPPVLTSLLKRDRAIKPLLLDQTVIAGLGNIYVDEVLWYAGVHPLTKALKVKTPQILKLHSAIKKVLADAIDKQGTDFGDGVVEMGMYRPVVYGRTDKPCKRCKTPLKRILVGQRSSHFCSACQKRVRSYK